jgi:multidrug efflux pump
MEMEKLKELKFTNWCIKNRTAIYVITILISIAGIVSYIRIPKEQFPDIVVPTISVVTIYPGNTPEDIENFVSKPIEKQLKSINGVRKVTSQSLSDVSIITVEFGTSTKVPIAKTKVQDAVDKAKSDLPADLTNDPTIQEFDISEMPIMNINLASDLPLDKLEKYAKELEEKIETLPQITRVDKVGGLEREVQIEVDLYKMQQAGLTFGDIEAAVGRRNVNISGGEIIENGVRRNVRVTGQVTDPKSLEYLVVRSFTGTTALLGDFADIKDGFKEKQDYARLDGKQVITLNVIKRSGENLIQASDEIKKIITQFKETKFPENVDVIITGDQSNQTRVQLDDLINTVIIGFILVLVVLMFFMGFKSAFFVALAGPLSSFIAFMIMPGLDFTLNVIVLFSFLLALGIIVDDAIVVIENTHRLLHKYPFNIEQAAKYGAGEVFVPVLAGTLTTLGPFVPLLFWPGVVGKFMSYIPITLIITLGASLFVAFVINPVFAVSFMKKDEHLQKPSLKKSFIATGVLALLGIIFHLAHNALLGNLVLFCAAMVLVHHFALNKLIRLFQDKLWPKVTGAYKRLISFLMKKWIPVFSVLGSVILLVISLVFFAGTNPKVDFFPDPEPNFTYIFAELPMGTDASVTDSVAKIMEKKIEDVLGKDNPNVESIITNIGLNAGDPQNPDRVPTPHKVRITVAFVKFSDRKNFNTRKTLEAIRQKFEDEPISGVIINVDKESAGPPTGPPVNVEISGDDFNMLDSIANDLKRRIEAENIPGLVELKSDLQRRKPEFIIQTDPVKMETEGITTVQVGLELRTALFGKEVSKLKGAEDDVPIMVRLKPEYREDVNQLTNVDISFMDMSTGRFKQVPISSLTQVKRVESFNLINRKNQSRVVNLSSKVKTGFTPDAINKVIQQVIDEYEKPAGYEIKITGQQEDQKETSDFLGIAFLGALALMFLIMVIQFNSAVKPLLIFSTVLFSLIGIFFGFGFAGMNMSIVMTGVGVFALAGIVIRNGILLIEFTDELRARGMGVYEAVIEAGATRMTPVILTAMSAILGLVPLAIGLNIDFAGLLEHGNPHIHLGGDNVAFWGPLAWTIIFGLTIATFLTLLVVPCMYIVAYKIKHKIIVPLSKWFSKITA